MKTALIVSLGILTFSNTVLAEPASIFSDSTKAGEKIFNTHCASCHGLDAQGDGPASKVLNKKPADLTTIAKRRGGVFPEHEIAMKIDGREEILAHGTRDMPVWGQKFSGQLKGSSIGEELVRGNLSVLVEYLKSLQR